VAGGCAARTRVNSLLIVLLVALVGCTRADEASPTSSPTPVETSSTLAPQPTPTPTRDPFELARSYEASSPQQLARRLNDVEGTIKRRGTVTVEDARLQQAAYRQLVRMPEWREPTYRSLDRGVEEIARANVEAGAQLRRLTAPREQLPPWRIVVPPAAVELLSHYRGAQREFGIDWSYLAAIHLVETRMGRIRGDSVAGAKGPMQFLPSTWAAYGEGDINDPRDAIRAAARYLRAHGAPADMRRALFAYNHSNLYVRAIELYARRMRQNDGAYGAYYWWDVYYRTTRGDALLHVGWPDA
jgi:hypothetical protein